MFPGRGNGVLDILFLHDVAADIARHSVMVFLDPRALVVLDVGRDHARAFGHEQIHGRPADAAGGAGDDRNFTFKTAWP